MEVARRLRSDRSQVPIVMLTARGSPADIMKGLDAGADNYRRSRKPAAVAAR
jgi:DNA-binding response OmpR family regulator